MALPRRAPQHRADGLARRRPLHPLDSAFTQAFIVLPLFAARLRRRVFAGVAAWSPLLAIFQHANVRLRFPVLRWVVHTPEWHHWHHAIDAEAHDKTSACPSSIGCSAPPTCRRAGGPTGFGIPDPVPETGYLAPLAYPFRRNPPAPVDRG